MPVAADDRHRRRARPHHQIQAGPSRRHGVVRALESHQRARRHRRQRRRLRRKRRGHRSKEALLLREADADRLPDGVPRGVDARVHAGEQRRIDRGQRRPGRNRDQRLLPDGLAAGLDAAFVVALARPTEAGLQQIVRGERAEPRRERARAADQDPDDRRPQIVVRDARRHAVEVRERAHVPVEKADLILTLVDPGEVATRVHQPHQKEPRLPTDAVEIDQHLEEVDLGEIARPIRQRHEHLAALALPLGDGLFDERDADPMALGDQQLVEPRGRQPLLATGPSARFGQQPVHPVTHGLPDRPRPDAWSPSERGRPPRDTCEPSAAKSRALSRPAAESGPPPTLCDE